MDVLFGVDISVAGDILIVLKFVQSYPGGEASGVAVKLWVDVLADVNPNAFAVVMTALEFPV